jgi:hypothetical protein
MHTPVRFARKAAILAAATVTVLASPALAVAPRTSNGQLVPGRTDATTKLVIALTGVQSPAQVSVDVSMINKYCNKSFNTPSATICHLTPGTSSYTTYTPCANDLAKDPAAGGCQSLTSNYYKIIDTRATDVSHGITIDRKNYGVQHNFALRVTRAFLEVTPYDTENYGAVRVRIDGGFPAVYEQDAHAFRSRALGTILLPRKGASDSARYSGLMRATGSDGVTRALPVGAVAMNWFGDDATTVHRTSTGAMVEYGFGGGRIEGPGGAWRSRLMFRGKYRVLIYQNKNEYGQAITQRRWQCFVTVSGNVTTSNFNFGPRYAANLGRPDLGCVAI